MEINYSIIGIRLKQARINKKLTQEKLAEMLDVSVTYISRVECGSTEINLKRLAQICGILDTSVANIVDGTYPNSESYLSSAFSDLLKSCPAEKIDLIYKLAEVVTQN